MIVMDLGAAVLATLVRTLPNDANSKDFDGLKLTLQNPIQPAPRFLYFRHIIALMQAEFHSVER